MNTYCKPSSIPYLRWLVCVQSDHFALAIRFFKGTEAVLELLENQNTSVEVGRDV